MSQYSYDCYKLDSPLVEPYHLAYGPIHRFESVFFQILQDGKPIALGESTALPGYSRETREDIYLWCNRFLRDNIEKSPYELYSILSGMTDIGFSEAPIITALEVYLGHTDLWKMSGINIPVIGVANRFEEKELFQEIRELEKQYHTIKVKIGTDVDRDARRVTFIQEHVAPEIRLRIDANQGYSIKEATNFLCKIKPDNIQLIEQPLPVHCWEEMSQLTNRFPEFDFMLDESIDNFVSIDKAVERQCCRYIKLKLFKCGSLQRLMRMTIYSHQRGLRVILGNGVQTSVGALLEAYAFHLLKKKDIPVFDAELVGPLKIADCSNCVSLNSSILTFYPQNIWNYYCNYPGK